MGSPRPDSDAPDSKKYRRIFERQEDTRLLRLVEQFGTGDWLTVAHHMPDRTARQCRERYKTYLCPDVDVSPWTESEDRLLLGKFRQLGSKWREFRQFLPNRSVNNIKNRWHKLARRGRAPGPDPPTQIPVTGPADPLSVFDISNLLNRPVVA